MQNPEYQELRELVQQMFNMLDYTEETDSGKIFHPIQFSCARALMTKPFSEILNKLRAAAVESDIPQSEDCDCVGFHTGACQSE